MRNSIWLPALVVVAAGIAGLVGEQTGEPVTVLYTGAAFGKLTPCGCTPESDMGGILRRDSALLPLRERYPRSLLVEAGGSFDEPSPQNRLGALAYVRSLRALGYDAAAIGAADLVYGREFLSENGGGLFFVSNLKWKAGDSPLTASSRLVERGPATVELIAIIDPDDLAPGDRLNVVVVPPARFLDEQCAADRLTVVLCSTSREKARRLLDHPRVEVVINAYPKGDLLTEPPFSFADGKVSTETAIYGSRIGVLRLFWTGATLAAAENQFVALEKQYADGERALPSFREYEEAVKKLFLARLAGQSPFDRAASPYAGAESCARCHQTAYQKWKKTKHPLAWETLKKIKKNFDPECIMCHTVGFERPGGFVSEDASPHLAAVGCEACHGPAKRHVEARRGFLRKPTLEVCHRCHTPERAPGFKPREGWKKIRHGRRAGTPPGGQ